jgi:catechol 2,3-dioxygenase-like lactoylglutathione lyase family enzyme
VSPLLTGVSHVDHVGLTVPHLDDAVRFFVDVFGAEELYRSRRGPDPEFMPVNFGVGPDAALELAMLRMPPNLNLELFEWTASEQRTDRPLPPDAGAHHLAFEVDDVDEAVARLRGVQGVRVLGEVKEVAADSPTVAGNRWTYVLAPWGLMIELVDRSRVVNPPRFVGPWEWRDQRERPQANPSGTASTTGVERS